MNLHNCRCGRRLPLIFYVINSHLHYVVVLLPLAVLGPLHLWATKSQLSFVRYRVLVVVSELHPDPGRVTVRNYPAICTCI